MSAWQTGDPPAAGVYRVLEPRAPIWYARWTGWHWCIGADNIAEAAAATEKRNPPTGWRRPRKRDIDRAFARTDPPTKPIGFGPDAPLTLPWPARIDEP